MDSSAAWLIGLCVEELFDDEELQVSGREDDYALCCWPPADVIGVGHQQVVICGSLHATVVVEAPHVDNICIQLARTHLEVK